MAIKKKPVLRKRLAKSAQPAAPPASDAASESVPEPEDEFAPAPVNSRGGPEAPAPQVDTPEDDGLALQETPETHYSGEKFKRPRKKAPTQNTGSALDVHDTSKLLLLAWIVIGAVVAISVYLLLVHANKSEEEMATRGDKPPASTTAPITNTSTTSTNPATPAAPLPGTPATSVTPVAPAVPVAPVQKPDAKTAANDARLTSNPSNKRAFEAYMTFGAWAYTDPDAVNWDGAKLTEKLQADVKLGNVDDPDITELCKLQGENFKLMNAHPLRPYEGTNGGMGEATRPADSENLALYKKNENNIKALTMSLRKRYGVGLK